MFGRTIVDELNDFRRSFDQIFDNFYSTSRRIGGSERSEWNFAPAVETGWTDDYLNLRVVLPGVTEKDLSISQQGNQLVIRGERKAPENFSKEGNAYHQLNYGKFERVLDLPSGLDVDKLQASLHDGMLDIRVPVAQAVKPRQIKITSGSEHQKSIAA